MTAWRSEGGPVERLEMIDPDGLAARLDAGERARRARCPRRRRVRRRPHARLDPHPLRASSPIGSASCPPAGRSPPICSGGKRSRPRGVDPPARGRRRGHPRRQRRRRHAGGATAIRSRPATRDAGPRSELQTSGRSNDVWSSRWSVSGSPTVRSSLICARAALDRQRRDLVVVERALDQAPANRLAADAREPRKRAKGDRRDARVAELDQLALASRRARCETASRPPARRCSRPRR